MKKPRKEYSLTLALLLILSICFYIFFRNNKVLAFHDNLSGYNLTSNADDYNVYQDSVYLRYTYNDYLFSLKPLETRYWFTEKDVSIYNSSRGENK